MELRQLRYFVTSVEMKSISKAAEACHIAQPSMSQQIASLENELGVKLLHRSSRGVTTTEAGERILNKARKLLIDSEDITQSVKPEAPLEGVLSIGIIPTVAPYMIAKIIREIKQAHPKLALEIMEDQTSVLVQALSRGEIECAIVSDVRLKDQKTWSVCLKELFTEPLLLALPSCHPLANRKKRPSVKEINADELIHLKEGHCLMDQALKACGIRRKNAHLKCDQLESALEMVSAAAGIAIVPELAAKRHASLDGISLRSFAAPQPNRVISLMMQRGEIAPPSSPFIEALADLFQ